MEDDKIILILEAISVKLGWIIFFLILLLIRSC